MPAWLGWLIAAAALAGAETVSLDLVLVMLAGGAAAGGVTAAAGAPIVLQAGVAVLVALGLLAFVRPVARRHLQGVGEHLTGAAALVGREAVALTRVDGHDGRVRLNGSEWSARSYDRTQAIDPGVTVRVIEIDGAVAVVWEEP